jgi:hypothetical protein
LLASWPSALAAAPSTRIAIRLHNERAPAAMPSSDATASAMAQREITAEP